MPLLIQYVTETQKDSNISLLFLLKQWDRRLFQNVSCQRSNLSLILLFIQRHPGFVFFYLSCVILKTSWFHNVACFFLSSVLPAFGHKRSIWTELFYGFLWKRCRRVKANEAFVIHPLQYQLQYCHSPMLLLAYKNMQRWKV